jgi:hypothetical protein
MTIPALRGSALRRSGRGAERRATAGVGYDVAAGQGATAIPGPRSSAGESTFSRSSPRPAAPASIWTRRWRNSWSVARTSASLSSASASGELSAAAPAEPAATEGSVPDDDGASTLPLGQCGRALMTFRRRGVVHRDAKLIEPGPARAHVVNPDLRTDLAAWPEEVALPVIAGTGSTRSFCCRTCRRAHSASSVPCRAMIGPIQPRASHWTLTRRNTATSRYLTKEVRKVTRTASGWNVGCSTHVALVHL